MEVVQMNDRSSHDDLVFSYLAHRTVIGILGIALPFVVSLGARLIFHTGMQSSISGYYHTGMRDVLVGTLFAIGFFLLAYRGFERRDDIAGNLACLFAVGAALFPVTPDSGATNSARLVGLVHLVFAGLFFATLIYFCLCLFTKTNPDKPPTRRKRHRNKVYRTCGYVMIVCVLLMVSYYLLPPGTRSRLAAYKPVFWLETLAILAFGISWFTKGEAILKDEVKQPE